MANSLTSVIRTRWRTLVRAFVTLFVYDVFISYARRDGRRYARALHRYLERQGIVSFLDRTDVLAGDRLTPTLAAALKKSRLFVLVATDEARKSPHVQREIETYLATGRAVVPVDFEGSYVKNDWPLLQPHNLVWLDERTAALASRPSPEVLKGVRQHLRASGSRVVAQRVVIGIALVVAALSVAAWWSSRRAADQASQREAEHLIARAALALDVDQSPLQALAYGVSAAARYPTIEVGQGLARVLPLARRPIAGRKVGRLVRRLRYSERGRYLLATLMLDTPRYALSVLESASLTERWRREFDLVSAEALSPDETLLVWADTSACVSIVHLDENRTLACLPHPGVSMLAFSADGTRLMTASRGSQAGTGVTVIVWTRDTWTPVARLELASGLWSAAIHPDGASVALGLQAMQPGAPQACLWDLVTSQDCRAVATLDEPLRSGRLWESAEVQFSGDGRLLLVEEPTRLTVLEVASGRVQQRLTDSTGFNHVRFDPSGRVLLGANATGLVTLYPSIASPMASLAQLVHPDRVDVSTFTPDGRSILTASDDGIVRVWDAGLAPEDYNDFVQATRLTGLVTHGPNLTTYIRGRTQSIEALSAAPDSQSFATAGSDGWVRVWSVHSEPDVRWSRHGQFVAAVEAPDDGARVVTASEFSGRVWALDPLRVEARLRRHSNDLTGAGISRDGRVIVTVGSDGTVFVFDAGNLRAVREIVHEPGAERLVRGVLSADGSTVATTSADRIVKLWRSSDGTVVTQRAFDVTIDALALTESGDAVALASGTAVIVWETTDWRERTRLDAGSPVRAIRWAGSNLLIGAGDGTVSSWEATTGSREWSGQHAGEVGAVAASVDRRVVASGGRDRVVRVWDAASGTELARLSFPFRVDAVSFVRDGAWIVAAGENYVHVSPWGVADLTSLACRYLGGLETDSWTRLLRDVDAGVCAPQGH